jgi:hypothetical protein
MSGLRQARSQAARHVAGEIAAASAERVRAVTDALQQAQPRACSAVLADGSFLTGQAAADSAARRAVRDMHAIHRDSLVVFGP